MFLVDTQVILQNLVNSWQTYFVELIWRLLPSILCDTRNLFRIWVYVLLADHVYSGKMTLESLMIEIALALLVDGLMK